MATTKPKTAKKPNKGWQKIEKLNALAKQIRNAKGYTIETIKLKKYRIATMSEAVHLANLSLKRKKVEKQGTLRFKK